MVVVRSWRFEADSEANGKSYTYGDHAGAANTGYKFVLFKEIVGAWTELAGYIAPPIWLNCRPDMATGNGMERRQDHSPLGE